MQRVNFEKVCHVIKIENLPSTVFGVRATGRVEKTDIENVLIPGLHDLVDQYGEIRYLLVLETPIKNFTGGAWLKDIQAGLENFTRWKRIAVVSDQKGVEWFTDIFDIAVPGSSKGFSLNKLEEAKRWVAETRY